MHGTTVRAEKVRYIKLGAGGEWERECFDTGTRRIGFDIGVPQVLDLCRTANWTGVAEYCRRRVESSGTATRYANEVRKFVEDDGSTLWISFDSNRLYWGFLAAGAPLVPHPSGDGSTRRIVGGWSYHDRKGRELKRSELAGGLTKLSMYRGTSCDVDCDDYLLRRVNGESLPAVESVLNAMSALRAPTIDLMRLLEPRHFELLIDLVSSASGWRRQGAVGKTQKTLDKQLPDRADVGCCCRVDAQSRTHQQQAEACDFDVEIGTVTACSDGLQQAAFSVGSELIGADSPYTGAVPSVWNVSQATPCGSVTQYLSLFA